MSDQQAKRIAVLTGGGDAPGLNAVIRAVAKTAIGTYGWSVIGFEDGFEGCINGQFRELDFDGVRGILPRGGTILGTSNRCNPFHYVNRSAGETLPRDHSEDVLERLASLGIDALVVIGGDGTLSVAAELHRMGFPMVGVPKTIDNDVQGTQVTFGFDSAVVTATDALDKLHTTAESHHRVMVVEVMGRTAGWIALYSGLAGGADVILLPEIPFDIDAIRQHVARRVALGRSFTIIVAAEGAEPVGGSAVYEIIGDQEYDRRYGGIGARLTAQLSTLLDQEVRSVVLGHLQRGGGPTPRDRILGTMFGSTAVRFIAEGLTGQMVAIAGEAGGHGQPSIVPVPLVVAGRGARRVPLDHPALIAARDVGISMGEPTPAQRSSKP
jgi:phosphofructokinase-like protein